MMDMEASVTLISAHPVPTVVIPKHYRDRAHAENCFDKLKKQTPGPHGLSAVGSRKPPRFVGAANESRTLGYCGEPV